jgi:hypothetical protein
MAITWAEADQERVLGRLAAIVSELPGTVVAAGHTDTAYLVRDGRFAWLLADHHGNGRLELWVKAPRGEQAALVGADPQRYFVPAFVGRHGWIGAHVLPADDPDWDELAALIAQAWRTGAGQKAVRALDAVQSQDAARAQETPRARVAARTQDAARAQEPSR